jgi:hypothetical protein
MFYDSPDFYSLSTEELFDACQDVLGLTDKELETTPEFQLEAMLEQAYAEAQAEANLRDFYTY